MVFVARINKISVYKKHLKIKFKLPKKPSKQIIYYNRNQQQPGNNVKHTDLRKQFYLNEAASCYKNGHCSKDLKASRKYFLIMAKKVLLPSSKLIIKIIIIFPEIDLFKINSF